ncbi:hypothetical protein [Citrobacter freundii]
MEKRLRRGLLISLLSSLLAFAGNFRPIRKPAPLAAAERPSAASQ